MPERIPLVYKQVYFYLDLMALLAGAGRDSEAVAAFLNAKATARSSWGASDRTWRGRGDPPTHPP